MTIFLIIAALLVGGLVVGLCVFLNMVAGSAWQKTVEEETAELRMAEVQGKDERV